tara:strand:+ start:955 stop:1365 length:411 start_codon:yes stop_codon:yes gene_type:complete
MSYEVKSETINIVRKKVMIKLNNEFPIETKYLTIPEDLIETVVINTTQSYISKRIGSIYSKEIQQDIYNRDQAILNTSILTIYNYYISQIRQDLCHKNLSIWNSVLGESNQHGLLPHPKIKLNNKRTNSMQFRMNY